MKVAHLPAYPGLFRPSAPVAASLLVNGLLLAALLSMGAGRQERGREERSLTILSLAALKGSEAGEDSTEMAEPSASAPVPTEAVQPPTPPSPVQSVAVSLPLPSLPVQASQPVAPRAVAAPSAAPVSGAVAVPSTGQGRTPPRRGIAEGLDADAPAGKSMAYAAKVRSWLYAHKVYPRRARMRREEGIVRVRFIIDRTGMLLEGIVIGSSGKSSLDEEAQAMMHRASPFPSAPAAITGERIEFIAPIEFILPV